MEFVVHVASPHILKPIDPLSALVDPAVKGTQYVLEMCQATASVKKLVLTSCMCAVSDSFDALDRSRSGGRTEYDERDWNTASSINRNSYAYRCTPTHTALTQRTAPNASVVHLLFSLFTHML